MSRREVTSFFTFHHFYLASRTALLIETRVALATMATLSGQPFFLPSDARFL